MTTNTIYLLCFAPGIPRGPKPGNACHYLGSCSGPPEQRLAQHLKGKTAGGSPLVKAAHDRGLEIKIVKTWKGNRQKERKMKNRHRLSDHCPNCKQRRNQTKGAEQNMMAIDDLIDRAKEAQRKMIAARDELTATTRALEGLAGVDMLDDIQRRELQKLTARPRQRKTTRKPRKVN